MATAQDIVDVFFLTDFAKLQKEINTIISTIENIQHKDNLNKKLGGLNLETTLGKLDLICMFVILGMRLSKKNNLITMNLTSAEKIMEASLEGSGKSEDEKAVLIEKVNQGDADIFLKICAVMTYSETQSLFPENNPPVDSAISLFWSTVGTVTEKVNQLFDDAKEAAQPLVNDVVNEAEKWAGALRTYGFIYARDVFQLVFSREASSRRAIQMQSVTMSNR